jgi:hypothetical protein
LVGKVGTEGKILVKFAKRVMDEDRSSLLDCDGLEDVGNVGLPVKDSVRGNGHLKHFVKSKTEFRQLDSLEPPG